MKCRRCSDDEGFTLIELLVVIIVIGILASIAIPVFLSQRKKAVDAGLKSDLRTVANQLESYASDYDAYPLSLDGSTLTGTAMIGNEKARMTGTNRVLVSYNSTGDAYCLTSSNPTGSPHMWFWISTEGGLQPFSTSACGSY